MADPDTSPSLAAAGTSLADEALWQAAVGKHGAYYLPRFAKYEREKRTFPSWHWPALFIAFWWALYRKAWRAAILFFFLPLLLALPVSIAVGLLAPENPIVGHVAHWACALVAWLLPPLLANGFYYRRVKAWVEEARARYPDANAQIAYLTGKGGTSPGVAVALGAFVAVSLIGILGAIALPTYQNYVARAKVEEALVAVEPVKQEIALSWAESHTVPGEHDLEALGDARRAAHIGDIRVDADNGTITVTFAAIDNRLNGKSIEWVPSADTAQPLHWTCRPVDAPERLLPASCRH